MAVSQSGYEMLSDYGDPALVSNPTVPGTTVQILGGVRSGAVATVLLWVASAWDQYVERLDQTLGVWGFDPQHNATTTTSNHKSGTAMDLNAVAHPQHVRGTFGPQQVSQIRRILDLCGGVVGWGGDFTGSQVDEMHVEIAPNMAGTGRVEQLAATLVAPQPKPEEKEWDEMATKEEIQQVFHEELALYLGSDPKVKTPKLRIATIVDGKEKAKDATVLEAITNAATNAARDNQ